MSGLYDDDQDDPTAGRARRDPVLLLWDVAASVVTREGWAVRWRGDSTWQYWRRSGKWAEKMSEGHASAEEAISAAALPSSP